MKNSEYIKISKCSKIYKHMETYKCQKASITVEAALVCPIFLFAVLTLINIIIWFGEAEDVQRKLTDDVRKIQTVSYISGNVFPVCDEDGNIDLMNMYVAGIHVPMPELVKPIVRQHVVSRTFSGITSMDGEEGKKIVYITPNGAVYHVSPACSYIKTTLYSVSISGIDGKRNESGGKYYPCERCGKDSMTGNVYITSYGSRYHVDRECTSVSRDVMAVFMDEIDGMRACRKCGGN